MLLIITGHNDWLPTLSNLDIIPNDIDFKPSGGQPTGRYTDRRTIADIVGEMLGVKANAQPFLDPNTTGTVILQGVSYASGGGGILNSTGRNFARFISASAACCGNGGQFAGIIPCGPTSSLCHDRTKHVFWDPYHSREAANLIIAKQLVDGDSKVYISSQA